MVNCFSWHSSHSPDMPAEPPQAHLRWITPKGGGVMADFADAVVACFSKVALNWKESHISGAGGVDLAQTLPRPRSHALFGRRRVPQHLALAVDQVVDDPKAVGLA